MENINEYKQLEDVSVILENITQVELPTNDEIIAEKEAKLLELYDEIQALKNQ